MDYRESIDYLLRFADYERLPRSGIVWDLGRIERLLARLGDPHLGVRTVHVTGTKGKGSTAAMVASILQCAGYRVGLYTSPHLLSYTERIRLNGRPIAEADWARLTEEIRPHVEAENRRGDLGELTTFEIFTAMALLHFYRVGADYQVVEVGLGGRIDATNVVRPEVCIITSISFDHTDVLGDTLAKIAGEKAGIIKPGADVVSAPQAEEAMAVIEEACRRKGTGLTKVGTQVTWQAGDFNGSSQSFQVKALHGTYDLRIPLLGAHQLENAACAVAASELLAGRGAVITPQHLSEGLANVSWPGRLQILRTSPYFVIDGAHNAYSLERLGEALRQYFRYDRLTLLLGFGWDKDVPGMIREAAQITPHIILVRSRHPKAVSPVELGRKFQEMGVVPRLAESIREGVKMALDEAAPGDLICAAGSIFVIAEVMEVLK